MLRRPRRDRPRRPDRPRHRTGDPVRPDAHPRRAPRRPLQHRRRRAETLIARWQQLGLARLPLDVVEWPGPPARPGRAGAGRRAGRRGDRGEHAPAPPVLRQAWRRILHDQTADRIVETVCQLPHVNATIVPFHVSPGTHRASPWCWSGFEAPRVSTTRAGAERPQSRDGPRRGQFRRCGGGLGRKVRPGEDPPCPAAVGCANAAVRPGRRQWSRRSPSCSWADHRSAGSGAVDVGRRRHGRQASRQARHDQSQLLSSVLGRPDGSGLSAARGRASRAELVASRLLPDPWIWLAGRGAADRGRPPVGSEPWPP